MENDEKKDQQECCDYKDQKMSWSHRKHWHGKRGGSVIYGFGVIGAAVFFLAKATTFLAGVIAIIKSIAWPAVLVYEALKLLVK